MKQVFGNKYIKSYKFNTPEEASYFLNHQKVRRFLSLDDTFGDHYFCYVCCHSLTGDQLFTISFCSDETGDNFNFLFCNDQDVIVLDTGKFIYLIDAGLAIIASFEMTTCVLGLYLTTENNLLLLEEISCTLVDFKGRVLKRELFDLIEEVILEDDKLIVRTVDGMRTFDLHA